MKRSDAAGDDAAGAAGVAGVAGVAPMVRVAQLGLRYGSTQALDGVTLDLPAGRMIGLIGPDGVGKSSLLALISGARAIQRGQVEVMGGDMRDARHRRAVCPRIAYMPQGLGKNLYPTLSVQENVDFFARLFGHARSERERRIAALLQATGLAPFAARPAGKLSGGMKQKLGLCCALIHDPDLLILDEPTTGVDPLSRRQFWELIQRIRSEQPGMGVLVATAYMEEALGFDWLIAMNQGRVLATGTPAELLQATAADSLDEAFIRLLPGSANATYAAVAIPPRAASTEVAIEARDLSLRFGDFVAVDHVSFRIDRGEIFGFLGSNGCGKTTTMKMLTGLLPPSDGQAWLFGREIDPHDIDTRRRVGYMSQSFSLYTELTVRQNLELHARLFRLPPERIPARVREMGERFGLGEVMEALPLALPLGVRQRLSLAVAMIHGPELLILDEPTSGVDPVARDEFWRIMVDLARREQVTIFISTHFMNEAERCDRISLMHAGKVLVTDTPAALKAGRGAATLDAAFIAYLEEAVGNAAATEMAMGAAPPMPPPPAIPAPAPPKPASRRSSNTGFSLLRLLSYTRHEALELRRDPIRLTLAFLGSIILLFVMGFGISSDVEDLSFAVLDRDQTAASRDYTLNLAGSRYFIQRPAVADYADMEHRMRAGKLSLVLEIPPGFARDMARGTPVTIGGWIDGSMPMRAETIQGYVQGMHAQWLAAQARQAPGAAGPQGSVNIETRFRYNPDVKSIIAMVPAVIPLLLMLIPAMLTALSVVREKELGTIVNLYVTPITRLEFLLGKQIPYVLLAMFNFFLLTLLAVTAFGVPLKGSVPTLTAGALLYVISSTAIGLLISSFMRSQIAAVFATALLTILPAAQFSGLTTPVSSLEGAPAVIGTIYPTTHFLTISRGVYSKALQFSDLHASFVPLLLAVPMLLALCTLLLKKQEH